MIGRSTTRHSPESTEKTISQLTCSHQTKTDNAKDFSQTFTVLAHWESMLFVMIGKEKNVGFVPRLRRLPKSSGKSKEQKFPGCCTFQIGQQLTTGPIFFHKMGSSFGHSKQFGGQGPT